MPSRQEAPAAGSGGPPGIRHVILDRDGVLNRELPAGWVLDYADWVWEDGALDALRALTAAGLTVSVVTNQSCIGRGLARPEVIEELHARMLREVVARGGHIDVVLLCPHPPEAGCSCRKPQPGLILEAIDRSGIPAPATLVVGDDARDLQAGRAAATRVALVRSGKGRSVEQRSRAARGVPTFDDLRAVVEWTLQVNVEAQ